MALAATVRGSWKRFGGGSPGEITGERSAGARRRGVGVAARGRRLDCDGSKNYPAMASFLAAAADARGSWRRFVYGERRRDPPDLGGAQRRRPPLFRRSSAGGGVSPVFAGPGADTAAASDDVFPCERSSATQASNFGWQALRAR